MMHDQDFFMDVVTPDQSDVLVALLERLKLSKDINYFTKCLGGDNDGRVVLMAHQGNIACGICVVNFKPIYPMFKRLNIPEIQDLNVVPDFRRQGVGAKLIAAAEDLARTRGHDSMGIGVGLSSSYGAAQRLYVRLGYIPDGAGVSYDGHPVRHGDMRPIDDDLNLYMVRELE
jgi:GNAT superfamily N-acetyltransferase